MPLPPHLDFDKVAKPALTDVLNAMVGWLSGRPRDETAFLNHLTGQLNRRRRACDVGVDVPMAMSTRLYMLHRQGPRQTDQYGADFALTVGVDPGEFLKTAIFQFKKSSGFVLTLSSKQIKDASAEALVKERSFILGIEETRVALRVKDLGAVAADFDHTYAEKSFDSSRWAGVAEWLYGWFACNIGPLSDRVSKPSIEALLQRFTIEPPDLFSFDQEVGVPSPDTLPAKAWLQVKFSLQEQGV